MWLKGIKYGSQFQDVKYSVLGVEDHSWANTFHRIPKLVDERLSQLGGRPIVFLHYADVKGDLLGTFDEWSEAVVKGCMEAYNISVSDRPTPRATVETSRLTKDLVDDKMEVGCVLKNDQLADTSVGPAKKHMDIRLPDGMTYQAGDYLVIQPRNPEESVQRVMRNSASRNTQVLVLLARRRSSCPQI